MPRLAINIYVVLFLVVLAGCTTLNDAPFEEGFSEIGQPSADIIVESREYQLSSLRKWELDGRFSLVTDEEAWTGKLNWYQQDNHYLIYFNAPYGQGALQLRGNDSGVELQLANGESYFAEDASALLKQETNWELPIDSLWFWIRGLPNPSSPYRVKKINIDGFIEVINQNDWQIEYSHYQDFQQYLFPKKIIIEHEDLKLRLVVTQWTVS